MAVVIRMRRTGRKNRPCFRINVTDSRFPRDGRLLETIGLYDPIRKATRAKQIERLAKGGGPSSAWQRFLARLIIKKDSDEAQPATSRAPTPSDQSFSVNFFRSSAAMASARS